MRELMSTNLDDEYEVEQLIPVESDEKPGDPSHKTIEDLTEDLPEAASVQMRIAVCEAVIDDIIETAVDNADPEQPVDSEAIAAEVEPLVDTAITLHLVPRMVKDRIPALIAKHLRRRNPQYALITKAAYFLTDRMTSMEADDAAVVDEVLDTAPADTGTDITEEVVKPEVDIQVTDNLPDKVAEAMRYLAASRVNERKATALVSKRISGALLQDTLHKLRHHLPAEFKRKYKIS